MLILQRSTPSTDCKVAIRVHVTAQRKIKKRDKSKRQKQDSATRIKFQSLHPQGTVHICPLAFQAFVQHGQYLVDG